MNNTESNPQESIQTSEPKPKKKSFKLLKLKFIIPFIIIAIIITSVCGIVMAKKKFRDGPDGFMMGMLIDKLDLTNDQKAQVEKLRAQIQERMESKKDSRENMMDEFANEFKKDNMDKNKLNELAQKRDQNMQENKEFMLDKMIEFHNILTPDQRAKAVDLMKEMKGKFNGMHDKMEKRKEKREKN